MDGGRKNIFFLDWRDDENSSIAVDRALFFRKYYGIFYGARYLFKRSISLRIAFRVLVLGRGRNKKHAYLKIPHGDKPVVKLQSLR